MHAPFNPPLTPLEVATAIPGAITDVVGIHNGGQAAVFRAKVDGKDGAVKIYYPSPSAGRSMWARSNREVAALQSIDCPTVVKLLGHGVIELRGQSCAYICTDFVEGVTLGEAVRSRGALSQQAVARIGVDLAKAIEALWERELVHRDMSPRNVMLRPSGGAVLIDLGLARHLALESLSVTGVTYGTEGYLSPEQARCWKQLTCKSDIFTLGVLMQECLLGRHPTGRQQQYLINGAPPSAVLNVPVEPQFASIVDRMTAVSPHQRPRPRDLADALSPFL